MTEGAELEKSKSDVEEEVRTGGEKQLKPGIYVDDVEEWTAAGPAAVAALAVLVAVLAVVAVVAAVVSAAALKAADEESMMVRTFGVV